MWRFAMLAAVASSRHNVVVWVPDEMRAESLGVYGHPFVQTPNMARLAREGTLFTSSFTTYPVCTQSRASFLTGRYTHNAGHRSLWNPLRYFEPNLLHYAKNASYEVAWYGKNDALDLQSFNMSVSVAGGTAGGNNGGSLYPNISDPRYYSFLGARPTATPDSASDAVDVTAAMNYLIARNSTPVDQQQPFFLYLPLMGSHPVYGCPSPYYDMYASQLGNISLRPYGLPAKPDYHDRIRYYRNITSWPDQDYWLKQVQVQYLGCISYNDYLLGKLMDTLQQLGLWDNTALFVLSDHGDYAGDYGLVEKWPSGLEDVLLRVPFIAKVPGGVAGQVSEGLVQHMDVSPTILDVMGVPAQHLHYGVSQYPVLMGQVDVNETGRDAVFAEGGYSTAEPRNFEGDCSDPIRGGALCNITNIYFPKTYQEWNEKLTVCRATMIRTSQYKLVLRSDPLDADHDSEFYDLTSDPLELTNQYSNSSYSPAIAALSKRLLQWYLQTSDANPLPYVSLYGAPDEIPRIGPPHGNWNSSGAFTPAGQAPV